MVLVKPALWFVVPVHGRLELASVCLRQLRRTCEALEGDGIRATAVVIGDRDNLRRLRRNVGSLIGNTATGRRGTFATIERPNEYLSMRFNDGIQYACDPAHNPRPADYVIPCGSDDWIDYRIIRPALPSGRVVSAFQRMSFVREDGLEITSAVVRYTGGCGIRIYPRDLVRRLDYRPADEDRRRGCDTSILGNVLHEVRNVTVRYADVHPRQIVDWKTPSGNLNSYEAVGMHAEARAPDPFVELAGVYPDEALEEMREVYA